MIVIEERKICRMLEGLFQFDKECEWNDAIEEAMHRFVNLPTIEAAPVVHAHWEQDSHGTLYCSRCGKPTYDSHDVPIEFNGAKGLALVWPYYCGFCGAKMDGGDKNAIS